MLLSQSKEFLIVSSLYICCFIADPSPPVLTGEAISGTQVLLSWQPPADSHGAIISYDIQYKFSSVGEYIKSLSVSTSSRTATIDSLLVGTEYNFKIRAQTDNGPGPFSEEITLSTCKS